MNSLSVTGAALAAFLLSSCTATDALQSAAGDHKPSGLHDLTPSFEHNLTLAYSTQTERVSTDCFPTELKLVLAKLNNKFGEQPVVTSGFRPRAGRSQHAKCKAADIRIPGVKPSEIAKIAKGMKGIGGVGTYCRTGIVHVDVGPQRTWHHC